MTDIPHELVDLLERLAFYNSVPIGGKICFKTNTIVSGAWGYGSFFRWYHSETSDDLIQRTDHLIDDSVALLCKMPTYSAHIYRYLQDMCPAISRLSRTYSEDINITSKLSVRLSRLHTILNSMTEDDIIKANSIRNQSVTTASGSYKNPDILTPVFTPPTPPEDRRDTESGHKMYNTSAPIKIHYKD